VTSTVNVKFNTDRDLDEESVSVSHDDDSIPANARTSVDDTQSPDDSDDDEADVHEDGNEQDDVEDDGHGDGDEQDDIEYDEDKDCGVAGEAVRFEC